MAMLLALLLLMLLTLVITAMFGWTVVVAWRTDVFRGIGWSVSRSARPVAFWFYIFLATVAGIVGLAFCILSVWITEQSLAG